MGNFCHGLILLFLLLPPMVIAQSAPVSELATAATALPLHLQHIFIGSSLILSLMCFAWARALRSFSMAILALFFAIKSLGVLAFSGISLLALFTDKIELLNTEIVLLTNLANGVLFSFTIKMFSLKTHRRNSYKLLCNLVIAMAFTVPLSYLLNQIDSGLIAQILNSISLIALLFVTHDVANSDSRLAKIFSLILLVQLGFNAVAYILMYWQCPIQLINCLDMLAFWFMAIMATYLMGRKYYCHIRDEKLAQQQVLASAKESDIAQQKLLTLQQESQEQLESRVQERTLELNIALQELEAVNRELKEKNTLDELSGLYNRRYYDQKILAEFRRSRRNLTPLSIVMIDIDHFKKINDSYGHQAGDKCIVEVANIIKSLLGRSSDVGCRYGGEEFCLILPETDENGALAMAEAICQRLRQQSIYIKDNVIKLTVSCGVSTYQQEKTVTPDVLFANADKALYQAKQAGRNQVQVNSFTEI